MTARRCDPSSRRPVVRSVGALAAAVVAAGLLTSCGGGQDAGRAARAYLDAWARGDVAGAAARTDDPRAAKAALTGAAAALGAPRLRVDAGSVTTQGTTAVARYVAHVPVAGLRTWTYGGILRLVRRHGRWVVHWAPADVHPALTRTTHLAVIRALPPRAPIVDGRGRPLFAERPVVRIGIEPARLHGHLLATTAAVARAVGLHDLAGLRRAVRNAAPHAFVPVITLRRAAYEKVRSRIYDLPGTVFLADHAMLAPTPGFAQALLGTVGPATADVLRAAGAAYRPGDALGLSGLQLTYQRRLAGAAGGRVVIEDDAGTALRTLATFPSQPGQPVRTTLDVRVQLAAEAALAHEPKPAALVAVRAGDGAVLAVANTPDATSYDRALQGHYPPGSTFKVVTTYALLGRGVTPTTTVPCPPSVVVGGKRFGNFEGEASANPDFATDFAMSCNTAFIGAARRLARDDLTRAATALGLGARWTLPVPAFSGSVPPATSDVVEAADAIGQGGVDVSPLAMAMVAAAVDRGTARAPVLVTDPAPPAGPAPRPLDPARIGALHRLMRLVVTSGTAAGAGLPPGTYGKTGTAEFGAGNPPATHAWFLGFRGDLAFVVLVEGGGVGGRVAAPLAAAFLHALPANP